MSQESLLPRPTRAPARRFLSRVPISVAPLPTVSMFFRTRRHRGADVSTTARTGDGGRGGGGYFCHHFLQASASTNGHMTHGWFFPAPGNINGNPLALSIFFSPGAWSIPPITLREPIVGGEKNTQPTSPAISDLPSDSRPPAVGFKDAPCTPVTTRPARMARAARTHRHFFYDGGSSTTSVLHGTAAATTFRGPKNKKSPNAWNSTRIHRGAPCFFRGIFPASRRVFRKTSFHGRFPRDPSYTSQHLVRSGLLEQWGMATPFLYPVGGPPSPTASSTGLVFPQRRDRPGTGLNAWLCPKGRPLQAGRATSLLSRSPARASFQKLEPDGPPRITP